MGKVTSASVCIHIDIKMNNDEINFLTPITIIFLSLIRASRTVSIVVFKVAQTEDNSNVGELYAKN